MTRKRIPLGREPFRLVDFFDPGFVVCPSCGGPAEVRYPHAGLDLAAPELPAPGPETLLCLGCPLRMTRPEGGARPPGVTPRDPFFGLELWAQAAGRYGIVWAISPVHLEALQMHVARPDRTNRPRDANGDWRARTPGWMSSSKNRAQVEKLLALLGRRFADAGIGRAA